MPTMSLTSSQAARFPTTDEIKVSMETAGSSVEGAEYLASRVRDLADRSKYLSKNPELKENIIAAVDKYVDYVRFKLMANGQPWSGQQVETSDLKNMQNNIAAAAAKELSGKLTDVKIDYAVSEKGHYVRGYSSSSREVGPETVSNLDKIFNAWLATKDYVIKGGFIYNAKDTVQNESTRINPETIKEMMKEGGLEAFMTEKGVNAQTRERAYPGEEQQAQVKHDAEVAVERAKSYAEEAEGPDVEPENDVSAGIR